MTRFQKVASALLGDRQDRDEAAQDPVAQDPAAQNRATGNRVTAGSPAATGSDAMEPASGTPGASPTWTPVSNADEAAAASSPGVQDVPATRPDRRSASRPDGPGGGSPRDYRDDPNEPAAGRAEPVAVTNSDVPVTAAGADPLAHADAGADGQAVTDAEGDAAIQPDLYGTARAGNGAARAGGENAAGAATIADVPVAGAAPGTATGSAAGAQAGALADADTGSETGAVAGTAGRHAAGPADGESRPGALGDFSDLTYGDLIPDPDRFVAQWQQIQFRFVDDPHGSVTEAADVVAQVTAALEAAIQQRQHAIEERQRAIQEQQRSLRGRWGEGTNADTEVLRETLRMYHNFLEQLIGSGTVR